MIISGYSVQNGRFSSELVFPTTKKKCEVFFWSFRFCFFQGGFFFDFSFLGLLFAFPPFFPPRRFFPSISPSIFRLRRRRKKRSRPLTEKSTFSSFNGHYILLSQSALDNPFLNGSPVCPSYSSSIFPGVLFNMRSLIILKMSFISSR